MLLEAISTKELLGGWKMGNSFYKYLRKSQPEDLKVFNTLYMQTLTEIEQQNTTLEIIYLFDNDDIKDMFLKMIFSNEKIDISLLNKFIDIRTLPNTIILNLYETLKNKIKSTPLTKYIKESEQNMFLESIDNSVKELKNVIIRKINIKEFYEKYKNNAIREYSRIKFFGIKLPTAGNRPEENKLESLYVVPNFSDYERNINVEEEELTNRNRLVFLGKPGAGKSTFIKYLILNNLTQTKSIPLRIGLKDYDTYLESNRKNNIIDYILDDLNKRFQTRKLNRDNVSDIFQKESFIFYFDGLDEVFSEEKRSQIRDEIENFGHNYENSKIIVTSRIVGYKDSPFDSNIFSTLIINDFNEEQINEYVDNWFEVDIKDNVIRLEYFEKFQTERASIGDDLLSNPLMLSIILILFTRGFSIPSSRLAIYQSCTETLVDKWEDQKELNIEIPKKSQAIAHLAYWQYEHTPTDETVALEMKKFYESFPDDFTYEEAEKNAYNFIDYLQKRSIYFNNIFVHKTFLEFYTARYIFTKFEKKGRIKDRDEIIQKYIQNSYWFVVLELLIAMIDKDQADNEVIEDLITQHTSNKEIGTYSFFIKNFRNLKNIGKKFRQTFLRKSFLLCLEEAKNTYQDKISQTLCSPEIADLHMSFDFLNDTDQKFIISLINEFKENYSFEVTAFFTELDNYKKLINENTLLKKHISSKMYAAYLLFKPSSASSYTNWKRNFHLTLLNTDFNYVFNNEVHFHTVSEMILSVLCDNFEYGDEIEFNKILTAIQSSTMSLHEIPISDSEIIPTYILIDMLETVDKEEERAFFLYLIYKNEINKGYTYLTIFSDVPLRYRNILIKFYQDNIIINSSKILWEALKNKK